MFKLLTEEGVRKVYDEYSRRRTAAILVTVTVLLFVANVGILPSYILSMAREQEVRERVRITESIKMKGDELALEEWLIKTNNVLSAVSPGLDTDRPSLLVDKVLSSKIAGIRILSFFLEKEENGPAVSISGIAASRQTLLSFRDRLNASGDFSSVDLPISDLALDKNIDFQIKLVPK